MKDQEKGHIPSTLKIDENDLPEIVDWKVNDIYEVKVRGKLLALERGPEGDADAEDIHAEFEVLDVESESDEPEEKEIKKSALKKAVMKYK